MRRSALYVVSVLVFVLAACSRDAGQEVREGDEIAEVAGHFLRQADIDAIIPPGCSSADSARIAEHYIRRWATDWLLYDNAQHNLSDIGQIEQMVEEYRKSLMIYAYEQQVVNQKMSAHIADEELQQFYDHYAVDFPLQENIVKGTIIVMPKQAGKQQDVRQWMKRNDAESLEKLQKYAMSYATYYDDFNDQWKPLSELLRNTPQTADINAEDIMTDGRISEWSDSTLLCIISVNKSLRIGQAKPFEYARQEMSEILLNKHKADYLDQFENNIYDDAVRTGLVNRIRQKQ
ncbi:MAG: hypothetical protein IJ680_09585 [Paludibacteraceae bacterium]|nr:hypothetical protein [Paludibacteraceae bacterium]